MPPAKQWKSRFSDADTIFVDPEQLLANPFNARIHSASQEAGVKSVLETIGWVSKIKVNRQSGYVIDGHLRAALAITHGQRVPIEYVDLDDTEEKTVLATYDWLTEMAGYDKDLVSDLLREIGETENTALQALLDDIATQNGIELLLEEPLEDAGPQIDRASELQAQWQTARGQIWTIPSRTGKGVHRLMCGDSTNAEDVARLMGGVKADLALTDPPYGVEMDKGFEGSGGFAGRGKPIPRRQYADDWDTDRPPQDTFDILLKSSRQAIIFGGNFFADILPQSTHWIVWDKLNTMPTFGDCELAWTNIPRKSVKKFTFEYNGLIGKEKERFHPTQKPLGLFVDILNAYSEASQIIFDLFLGSGTTLIASEQTGRICYSMEIAPEYVAVTLQRCADIGLTPTLDTPPSSNL